MTCLELFSGAGGLATGLQHAGIQHIGFIEVNKHACSTLAKNYDKCLINNNDIKSVDFSDYKNVELIAGGPPCQPFSLGGKHKGNLDRRDMFPFAVKAIKQCTPKAFIFENVKGLLRKSFSSYFEYIILRLTYPNVTIKDGQSWENHLSELEKIHTSGRYDGVKYNVVFRLVDSADYGIPQRRERVIIVGIRNDLNVKWSFPKKTHSLNSLLWSQYVTKEYWQRHGIYPVNVDQLNFQIKKRVEKLRSIYGFIPPSEFPWQTVRDVIGHLPFPDKYGEYHSEHILHKGARIYPGHTGSYIDLPSKAIKAGVHGVPGGENMIRYQDGSVRYFTTFEAKKIQTFPDQYCISGSWTEAMRQIGNAVPVQLGELIGKSLINKVWNQVT
ncbi:MAG: DNA cytosine methyltransferase [Chloroflexi bacterium]|nr:DNA cytosine methyltransferase [Chloroflexota bacterium]